MKLKKLIASMALFLILLVVPQYLAPYETVVAQEVEKAVWVRPFGYNPPPVGHWNYFISGSIPVFDFTYELMTHYFAANGTYVPLAAAEWKLDPNYMWFWVKLRQGVRFHDGHELTYKDVLSTLYCVYLLKDRLWYYIKDVNVVDDYTLNFTFKERTDYPVFYILWHWAIVSYTQYGSIADRVQAKIREGYDIFADTAPFQDLITELQNYRPDTPIGCGPYKVKSVSDTMIVLEAFDDYWNGRPMVDEIHLVRYATADLQWQALYNREADYVWAISPAPELSAPLEEATWGWTIRIPRPVGVTLYINKAVYPLSLVEVRRALAYAINRSEVGWVQYVGGCVASEYVIGFHVPALTRYLNQSFIDQYLKDFKYEYNPQKAEEILQGLGFRKGSDGIYVTPNGTRLEFELLTGGTWINAPAAENLAAQLAKVGIKINPRVVDSAVWTDAFYYGKYQLTGGVYGSPGFAFDEYYHKYITLYPGHDPAKNWGQLHSVPWKTQPVNVTKLAKDIPLYPAQISAAQLTEIYSELSYITGNEVPVINLYQPAVLIYMDSGKFVFPTDPGYWNGLGSYELHGLRPLFTFNWMKPKISLTVATPEGGTLSLAPGVYEYGKGDTVTITATPSSGYTFDRWEVDGSAAGTSSTITITMDRAHTVRAIFSRIPYELYIGVVVVIIVIAAAAYYFLAKRRK